MTVSSKPQPYLIWLSAAMFYMFQFVLRVSPNVMLDDLMADFHINASEVGALSAMSMYAYSLFQVPSGILADLYGVRRVILSSILICVLGVLIFTSSDSLWIAKVGRFFMGAGSAAAFLCVSKVSTEWFSPHRRATLFGLTMAAGTIGALNGGYPLYFLVSQIGWKKSLFAVSLAGALIFAMNAVFSKEHKKQKNSSTPALKDMLLVLKHPQCWMNGLTALGVYLCISVIADLWGISFVVQVFGLSKELASQSVSLIYLGLCCGSLMLTSVSDFLRKRKAVIVFSTFGLLVLLSTLLLNHSLSAWDLSVLFFLIGFFSGAEMLCFASASDEVDPAFAGTVTGFINCVVMLGGACLQELVGRTLDWCWSGGMTPNGIRAYASHEYRIALGLLVILIFFSSITACFLKQDRLRTCP